MAAKSWDNDFRREAVLASLAIMPPEHAAEPDESGLSYCLPVHEKPIVGVTPGRIMLLALVAGFGLMGLGVLTIERAKNDPTWTTVGVIFSFLGFSCFWVGLFDRFIMRCLLGERGRRLAEQSRAVKLMSGEISDANPAKMTISIDGDDYVLILFDPVSRRVIIEGIAARYQIHAADIEALRPFEIMNYVGVEVLYRIGPAHRLRLAIAKVSILQSVIDQVPIFFFLKGMISNRLLTEFRAVFRSHLDG